jgi:fatty acid desaturase
MNRGAQQTEWPTVLAIGAFWLAYLGTVLFGEHLPTAVTIVVFALLGGFYMSLQHEVIHGHPTRWRLLNRTAVGAPLVLVQPFERYSVAHLAHHASDITNPIDDPESFYVTPQAWAAAGPAKRWFLRANRTMAARLTIGPVFQLWQMLRFDLRLARHDTAVRRSWLLHLVGASITVAAIRMAGMPLWIYLVGFVHGGMMCTNLRSFVEHRGVVNGEPRSAVVQSNWFFGLLFLNNNLHYTHHALPGASWYRLPQLTRDLGAADLVVDGAGYHRGYLAIARKHLFRPFDQPINPLLERIEA